MTAGRLDLPLLVMERQNGWWVSWREPFARLANGSGGYAHDGVVVGGGCYGRGGCTSGGVDGCVDG